uniref:Lachesin n=1 Tax=Aceria tosichella TaxID=561515 RepID=A0A6G1S8R6_9ACAR
MASTEVKSAASCPPTLSLPSWPSSSPPTPFMSLIAKKSITLQALISFAALTSLIASTSGSISPLEAAAATVNGSNLESQLMQNRPSPRAALAAIGEPAASPQLILAAGKEKYDSSGSTGEEHMDRFKRRTAANSKLASSAAGKAPEFVAPIGNVSAVLGRDVRLVCTVENLGQHQIAWLKEETKTILSIDTNIIITNYRIFLIPDDEGRKWVLHIKDVQESDRGSYQCQINTNPMRSISGYLDVVVPPSLIETESTQVAEVMEHSNVSLQCKASGHPKPTIGWRREDGEPIKLIGGGGGRAPLENEPRASDGGDHSSDRNNGSISTRKLGSYANQNQKHHNHNQHQQATSSDQQAITHLNDVRSDRLFLTNVDRSMAGLYICTASNGIPSPASRQIPLYVKFVPKVSIPVRTISVNLGEQLDIDCLIEAFPKPTSYWSERQFIEPARPFQARLSNSGRGINQANGNELRLRRFGSPSSPRWHQGHKFLMTRGDTGAGTGILYGNRHASKLAAKLSGSTGSIDSGPSSIDNRPRKRQADGGANSDLDWEEENTADNEPYEQLEAHRPDATAPNGLSLSNSDNKEPKLGPKVDSLNTNTNNNKAYVTVKQTALNPYTYKLRISIAKMRPSDLGEYVCTSSNSMGTSSARVLVKRAERNQTPAAAAVESTLARPLGMSESSDNQAGYQRDSMSSGGGPASQAIWSPNQFIQAQKSHRSQLIEIRPVNSSSMSRSSHSNRVYDENYLQTIRNRQSSNGYVVSSSSAFGTERNSAGSDLSWPRSKNISWLYVVCSLLLLL